MAHETHVTSVQLGRPNLTTASARQHTAWHLTTVCISPCTDVLLYRTNVTSSSSFSMVVRVRRERHIWLWLRSNLCQFHRHKSADRARRAQQRNLLDVTQAQQRGIQLHTSDCSLGWTTERQFEHHCCGCLLHYLPSVWA